MAQKIRVFTLAREFNLNNESMVTKIQDLGIEVRNYMSALDTEIADRVRYSIHKERTENTVEEHIRPTVIRRRRKDGGAITPIRPKPPKVELTAMPTPAPKAKPAIVTSPKPVLKPVPAPASIPESTPTPKATPETTLEPVPTPAPEPVAAATNIVEAQIDEPTVEQPTAEETNASTEAEPTEKAKPTGVDIASRPTVLRPSTEAPLIRRRIVVTPGAPSRPTSRGGGGSGGGGSRGPSGPTMPDPNAMPSAGGPPGSPDSSRGSGARRARTSQRKREVPSREIAPQGRFSGTGPAGGFTGGKFRSNKFGGPPGRKRRMAPGKKGKKTEITTPKASKRVIRIEEQITLQELSKRMGIKATEVLMQLMDMGVGTININSTLDADTAKIVASDFGYEVEDVAIVETDLLAFSRAEETAEEQADREPRPPVITMMGHVDHGKTSLLDAFRKSDIVSTEAGGITQHIGAYRVKTKIGAVTFIDTPGHEAFTAMRARGANATDLVILVTAADDGVMPQTIEAINHARAAEVPIIVAINKCDLPGADTDRTKRMLMEQSLVPEELGGDTIIVEVSAKTGEGLDKLLEMITLQSEIMELTANSSRAASGIVLEAYLDRGRGPVANVLVQDGTLKPGAVVVAGGSFGKIRAMTDEHGKTLKEAGPSTPIEVLGLGSVPGASDLFDVVEDLKIAEKVSKSRVEKSRASNAGMAKPSLEALYEQLQTTNDQVELKVIVKADVQGTVEALRESLQKQTTDKVKVTVVHSSPGGITESDVLLASTAGAIIIGFNVRPAGKSRKMAETQGVEIRIFSIIYEVVDSIRQAMVGLLVPETKEETLGQVEVRNIFTIPKVGTIAGSYVTEGKIIRNSGARLIRDSVQIWKGKLSSLKRFKDDVKEVANGFECGISLEGYNDIKVGDVIEIFIEKEIAVSLT
jgi:translation initiation factor IF-2